jgi:hypothetical protein
MRWMDPSSPMIPERYVEGDSLDAYVDEYGYG